MDPIPHRRVVDGYILFEQQFQRFLCTDTTHVRRDVVNLGGTDTSTDEHDMITCHIHIHIHMHILISFAAHTHTHITCHARTLRMHVLTSRCVGFLCDFVSPCTFDVQQ